MTGASPPGRPRGQREVRYAFYHSRVGGVATIVFPRSKVPVLAAALDGIEVEPALAAVWASPRPLPPSSLRTAQDLYPYQEAAVAHLHGLERPEGGWAAYLQMGTGLGKTRVGLAAAVGAGGPVFVVVPTLVLRTQWFDEARHLYPGLVCAAYVNPPVRGRGADRPPPGPADADLVVGILDTVRKKTPGFFSGYAMVVLDEAHELHAPCSQELLWLAQGAPRVLGLSATPAERPDGLDRFVTHFLGPPLYAETDIPRFDIAAVAFRGRVREVEYAGGAEYVETVLSAAGTVSAIQTIGNVVRDPCRLRLVAAEVERLYFLGERDPAALGPGPPARAHGVLVFAEHRAYLPALRDAIMELFAPPDLVAPPLEDGDAPDEEEEGDGAAEGPVVLRGGCAPETLGRARAARIVLTTYGYSRRGVSLSEMTALVLATPRRNGMTQILGRITRRGSDETIIRQVVDIKDVSTALKSQSSDRRKAYKAKNWPIARLRTSYADFEDPDARAAPTAQEAPVWGPAL